MAEMWKPPLNFITLHYTWIIFCSILGLIVIYPNGGVQAVDAYFFGASASTESGLNTVDLKDLQTYQQLALYFIPIFTNLGFINILVVAVRLYWFKQKFKTVSPAYTRPHPEGVVFSLRRDPHDVEGHEDPREPSNDAARRDETRAAASGVDLQSTNPPEKSGTPAGQVSDVYHVSPPWERYDNKSSTPHDAGDKRQSGLEDKEDDDDDKIRQIVSSTGEAAESSTHRVRMQGPRISAAKSIENVASSLFVLRPAPSTERRFSNASRHPRPSDLPALSKQVTIGRNSRFLNLSSADREKLGGIEYRALKVLFKIVVVYFFGLHLFGAICLVGWIHHSPAAKYTDWLAENGQDRTWWAFYSAQTMVDNLGFTLTPDSMITFADATWPMLIMSFLAFAGNTLYPVLLRLCVWLLYKVAPADSSAKDSLRFLLDHPRRCYTLLFPSRPTWILFAIIFALNFTDVVLIITLDLNNPAVNHLPIGSRILAAIFQAASARHTGTSTFNLANVNPGVQFSLLVMMYIAILPIAIAIRASNTYEERALGVYESQQDLQDGQTASTYVKTHVQNQLSFDLWYIFLGTFCLCCAEAERIVDLNEPAFSVFSVFFEVVSAYGNVGLSLGHPAVMTSLSGQFSVFGKLVICAMMIRGRHRGLPYALDRAIMLPDERDFAETLPASRFGKLSLQDGTSKSVATEEERGPGVGLAAERHHTG